MKGANRNERREARLVKRLATIQEIAEHKGIAKRRRQTEATRAIRANYLYLSKIQEVWS